MARNNMNEKVNGSSKTGANNSKPMNKFTTILYWKCC